MPDLGRPQPAEKPPGQLGIVSKAPSALGEEFEVVVPTFSPHHVFQIRRWEARGALLPVAGDEVLVVRDDAGEPWAAAWWPALGDEAGGGAAANKGVVVHDENPALPRPGGYASVEWIGIVEPANAIDNDTWVNPGK